MAPPDVTEYLDLQRHHTRLARQVACLQRTHAALQAFGYTVSSSMQPPLQALAEVAGHMEAELPADAVEARALVVRLHTRIERLSLLHGDLRTYAQVGQAPGERRSMDIGLLVTHAWAHVPASAHGQLILAADLPRAVVVVVEALAAVLQALLDNAVVHHDAGGGRVQVRGHLEPHRPGGARLLVVEIEDDGPGIEPRFADQVFRPLVTLSPRDRVGGCGMGLAIARKRAEVAGGQVHLVPRAGRGAVFRVEWPVEAGP